MEPDPLRLAWTTNPLRHLLGFLLLALAGLFLLLGLDLVRIVTDRALAGAGAWNEPAALLRIAVSPPANIWPETLVLSPGLGLDPALFAAASIGGLLILPVLMALTLAALDWTILGIGSSVLARIRSAVLAAAVKARPSPDGASATLALTGAALAREARALGAGLLVPMRLGGTVGLAVAYALVMDWHLGAALAASLAPGAVLSARSLLLRRDAAAVRDREGEAAEAILADLEHRIPALRTHGTGPFERDRACRALAGSRRPVVKWDRRLALAEAASTAALAAVPLSVLAMGVWLSQTRPVAAGTLASCIVAAALASYGAGRAVRWHGLRARTRALLSDIAQRLAVPEPQDRTREAAPLPESGSLVAQDVSVRDPASGARIADVNLSLVFPSHVALVGDGDPGPRLLAALIGGRIAPAAGRLTYAGLDLAAADPVERARRIAFAGEAALIRGSLRENLLYGCPGPADERDRRLSEAVTVVGLDRLAQARGLSGTLDPRREPETAAAIVDSRRAMRAALARGKLDRFVAPFDPERYNRYATVGENLVFGRPAGAMAREDGLSGHPFMRALLRTHDLSEPLARIGLSVATCMVETFAQVPDAHPLLERFSLLSASDLDRLRGLVERQRGGRDAVQAARDQERLIGLALRYDESRHRLGLVDEALEARILAARADFARMLPVSLGPSIEFFDEHRFCAAASVQDNLLFGRIASDRAGAAEAVQGAIRHVLAERGLGGEVSRIGLDLPVDVRDSDLTPGDLAAIDLVRCLVRRPSVLVVERALDGLSGPDAVRLVRSLRRHLVGRGLVLVTPEASPAMSQPPFDAIVRFEGGQPVTEYRHERMEALSA